MVAQTMAITKINQPTRGTAPEVATNAIGTPQPNAIPRYTCGAGKNLLKNGYVIINPAATNANATERRSSCQTSASAIDISATNSASAS